jgi:hypothetical protein
MAMMEMANPRLRTAGFLKTQWKAFLARTREGQGDPLRNVRPRAQGPRILSKRDRGRRYGRRRQAHSRLPSSH